MKRTKKESKAPSATGAYLLLLTVLVCVIFGSLLFSQGKRSRVEFETAVTERPMPEIQQTVQPEPEDEAGEPLPVGSLVQSGKGLNENYYGMFHFSGMISDLSDISFVMGRGHTVSDLRTGTDRDGSMTVYYGEDTVIKTAVLNYREDSFEIYMGSLDSLAEASGYMYEVILKDPDADALWATEIVISEFVY